MFFTSPNRLKVALIVFKAPIFLQIFQFFVAKAGKFNVDIRGIGGIFCAKNAEFIAHLIRHGVGIIHLFGKFAVKRQKAELLV